MANERANAWLNGTPPGPGTTRCGTDASPTGPVETRAPSASAHGSGFMTMPAPPPKGLSSTVRWRSWAKSRRSCTRTSRMPSRRALPMSDRSRGARYSGKIETTSRRMVRRSLVGELEQAGRRVDDDAAGLDVDVGDDLVDERHQGLATA